LNHYPGPKHALDLAEQLGLSSQQRAALTKLMDAHRAQARAIGAKLVAAERAIDELFRAGTVDEEKLRANVAAASALQGEYRLAHLETHRRARALLTAAQVERYDALRGYTGGDPQHHGRHAK